MDLLQRIVGGVDAHDVRFVAGILYFRCPVAEAVVDGWRRQLNNVGLPSQSLSRLERSRGSGCGSGSPSTGAFVVSTGLFLREGPHPLPTS